MDRPKSSSKSSSKSSKSSIYTSRELIAREYRHRFVTKYKGHLLVLEGKDLNFYIRSLKPIESKNILNLRSVLNDGDVLLLRPKIQDEYLNFSVRYKVIITVNAEQLQESICSLSQGKREKIIVLTNGPDIGDLNKIQADEVTSLKAIIWFNAGLRGIRFNDASDLLEIKKKKKNEIKKKIADLTRELQETKRLLEESMKEVEKFEKREEANLKRLMELEEERKNTKISINSTSELK